MRLGVPCVQVIRSSALTDLVWFGELIAMHIVPVVSAVERGVSVEPSLLQV